MLLLFRVFVAFSLAPSTLLAETVRVGYLPNLTHAQVLVGLANSTFQKNLGAQVDIKPFSFNAGPAVVEALFAGAVDVAYIGPGPAINAHLKSRGDVRIIAGAASGGARLIVREGSGIGKDADFHGKKIATPQLGNTQDLSAREWLAAHELKIRQKGGDVDLIHIANADQLTLFLRGGLDAAWAPEPWASRLIHEAKGRVYLDERSLWPDGKFATTVLVVGEKFKREHPDLLKRWIVAHLELTDWIGTHPDEAKTLINQELKRLTRKELSTEVLRDAFAQVSVTLDPLEHSLKKYAATASANGFLGGFGGGRPPQLSHLVDLTILNEVLRERKLKPIPQTRL